MLHFIITNDEHYIDEFGKMIVPKYLEEEREIESMFTKRLVMPYYGEDGEPKDFTSELSDKLIYDVDHCTRTGQYEVFGPDGKCCIIALSTDVKFGLLAIDEAVWDRPVIIKPRTVSERVLKWLAENGDFTLMIIEKNCSSDLYGLIKLMDMGLADIYYGRRYTSDDSEECKNALKHLLAKEPPEKAAQKSPISISGEVLAGLGIALPEEDQ